MGRIIYGSSSESLRLGTHCYVKISLTFTVVQVCREASATSTMDYSDHSVYFSPVQNAEREAFCKACLLFGLGLYLYHSPDAPPHGSNSDEYLQVPP